MSLYNPEGTPPIITSGVARIERRLPYPGEVLVRTGGRVEPEDIVATALVPAQPFIVNVAQKLAIPPSQIERALRREVGNKIAKGEELAHTNPLFGRTCPAPVSGVISSVDTETGYVTITPDPVEFSLLASIRGIVMDVLPYQGVIIETPAAQVYGVFGLGSECGGVLRLMVTDPTEVVPPDKIDARCAYSILICGSTITAAALRRAIQEQVRGVIVGSIDEQEVRAFLGQEVRTSWFTGMGTWQFPDLRRMPDPGLTVVVTEGFGKQPMSQPIFDLLSSKDRQEALIEGVTYLRQRLRRPRLVVPLTRGTGETEPQRPQIRPGVMVRLLDAGHLGQVASVRTVSTIPRCIESGVRVSAVEVIQDGSPPFWVPRTAIEVLG